MGRRVVLHVGTPKSGTTFLQRALWRHREELRGLGVVAAGDYHYDMFHAAIEVREAYEFWGRDPEQLSGTWRRLCDQARAFDGTTIMSHELLGAARKEQVADALAHLDGLEVHVVVTARDLARQLTSEWQERVKNGNATSFGTFSSAVAARKQSGFWRNQHVVGVVDRWSASLPPERVHIVVGPPPGSAPDLLWRRFGEAVGFDAGAFDPTTTEPTANKTLGAVQVALLRRVNEALDGRIRQPAYGRVVKRAFAQTMLAGQSSPPPQCPPELAQQLRDIATRQNERILQRGYAVHGDLDELLPRVPERDDWVDPDRVDPEAEAAAAAAAIAALLEERVAVEEERDRMLVPTARRVGGRVKDRLVRLAGRASRPGQ